MPTETEVRAMVRDDYVALADLLDDEPGHWDTPSLCEGWRVREVVAHLTMPIRYDQEAFMEELREDDFDFTRLSNRIATRDARLPESQLVANLRDPALHAWEPPGGGHLGALSHVVIHELDITVPLGVQRRSSDPTILAVLDLLTVDGAHEYFGTEIKGRRFVATDVDWTFGSGTEVRAPGGLLVLHLSGRSVLADPA